MALPLLLSFLGSGLAKAGVLGAAGSFLANPLIMGAIGSGLGTALETGDVKKGIGAGLGSFAGGQLLGGMMGGAGGAMNAPLPGQSAVGSGAGAMTTGAPLQATQGMSGLMPPPAAAPKGIAGLMGGRAGDVLQGGMQFGSSAQGIGSMIGGALGAGVGGMPQAPTEQAPDISQIRPMERQMRTPGPDYVPGRSGEFDYGVSDPYTTDYMNRYAPQKRAMGGMVENPYAQNYAEQRGEMMGMGQQPMMPEMAMMPPQMPLGMAQGGVVQRMVPQMGPVYMQEGGIANIGAMAPEGAAPAPNEREVISAAISAIQGQHPQPELALGAFLAQYGESALRDLVDRVQSGEMGQTAAESEGKLAGPGDGMNDMIPASIEGQQDVLLSDGEYIVPADVVSGLGNGSSDAGAKALDNMAEKVRVERTGRAQQAPAVPQERMMPV
jgi:hypothetical protein